jgi:uncharacterized membrane protein
MPIWFMLVVQISALACAILGGVFLAFSDFLMRSLSLATPPAGVEVMQVINREVFRFVFIPLFLAMVPVSIFLAGYSWWQLSGLARWLIVTAALVYLLCAFGVTALCNVPLNNQLAAFADGSTEAQDFWVATYLRDWTSWNTVRTMACIAAAVMLMTAVAIRARSF